MEYLSRRGFRILSLATAKGIYLRSITLSSTMGPGLVIDQASLEG